MEGFASASARRDTPCRRAARRRARPRDFPILRQQVHGRPLVYLDNAATTQKPQGVSSTRCRLLQRDNANVHRGVHELSELATEAYEGARETVRASSTRRRARDRLHAQRHREHQPRGADVGPHVGAGDEVLISAMEHHSNIVPWQMLCEQTGRAAARGADRRRAASS
jgi:cysteine desulfurase / selenocysteine lyase